MIEHCEPVDLVNFLAYSFYCTPDLIPESFPRAEVLSWLVDELGVSEVDADDAVTRLEARLGWAVPSAASQPSPASRTRIFGRTEAFMHPHYRPLALVALIALAHWVASSYMRYVLGFALMHPLRHDLKGTLRFFVLHPVRRGGDLPCHDRPLLCFHGFGFGVIPYTFALTFVYLRDRFLRKSHPERRRVIIIPEFLWLGLDPLGGAWAWSNVMDVWRQLIHQPSRRRRASLEGVLRIGRSGDMVLPSMGELVDEIHNVCYWVVKNPSAFTGTLQHILPTADCIDYSSRYQHMTRLRRPASRASIPCLSDPSADFTLDVFAHSYGTAVASAFYRAYRMSVGKVVLGDPICFLVQVTKKVQLCGRRPWQVELLDRPYSNHSSVLGTRRWCEGVEARPALSTRRRLSIGVEWVVDKALLLFYWYVVYRDFGTRWTTARQLKGHEYIDDGSLLR
ncbi:MAG: uncharacterized protein KVP18_004604 [Porospora cf. gigantea A]|uniref:uncharacterized protein n=1 Tax=Porospora cf. gigantea A TaxID=2853593 RepID=UPI00355A205E|nr:MAG: hypothetical protein KVP18_004604 [Porospora cf. gigantea A]